MAVRVVAVVLVALAVGSALGMDTSHCTRCVGEEGGVFALMDGAEDAVCVPRDGLDKTKVWWMADNPQFCGVLLRKVAAKADLDMQFGSYLAVNLRAGDVLKRVQKGMALRRVGTADNKGKRYFDFTLADFSELPAPWLKNRAKAPAIAQQVTNDGLNSLSRLVSAMQGVDREVGFCYLLSHTLYQAKSGRWPTRDTCGYLATKKAELDHFAADVKKLAGRQTLEDLAVWMTKAHAQYEFWGTVLYGNVERACAAGGRGGNFRGRAPGGGGGEHGGGRGRVPPPKAEPAKPKPQYDIYYVLKLGETRIDDAKSPQDYMDKQKDVAEQFSAGLTDPPTDVECKKLYRKAALKYHPDKLSTGEAFFKVIQSAYEITQDTHKKLAYDNRLFDKRGDRDELGRRAERERDIASFDVADVDAALLEADKGLSQFQAAADEGAGDPPAADGEAGVNLLEFDEYDDEY